MDAQPHTVVIRKRGFFSTVVVSVSFLAGTLIVSVAAITMYAMTIFDDKIDDLASLGATLVEELPEIQKSLPPVLADCLDDRRAPEYQDSLEVEVKLVPAADGRGHVRPVLEVTNAGEGMVTYLTLHLVVTSGSEILAEWNEWVATPIAADDDWPGPLLAGGVRRFSGRPIWLPMSRPGDELEVEVEVTDVRLWRGPKRAL